MLSDRSRRQVPQASDCIYQMGLSDLGFPFMLFFVANPILKAGQSGKNTEVVHADIDAIPVGMTLGNLYVCLEPVGDEIFNPDTVDNCGAPLLLGDRTTSRKVMPRCTLNTSASKRTGNGAFFAAVAG